MTQRQKWDGIGFSVADKKVNAVLVEFSGGIEFNNTTKKEMKDIVKIIPAAFKSATREITPPIPNYLVRYFGGYT
jgi:hypothetical protein